MEPFSIATGVAQLIAFADTLTTRLVRFIRTVKSIPGYINDVYDEIIELRNVLFEVKNTLDKRVRQLPFERNHHVMTHNIIQSCHNSLNALKKEVPPLEGGSGTLKCVWRSIEHSFNEERIRQITERLGSYKSILNISLTTLLLLASNETASSQQVIEMELRKLRNLIQSSSFFSRHADHDDLVQAQMHSTNSKGDGLENSILEKEIRDWRQTVDDVATGIALSDGVSYDARSVAQDSSMSIGIPTLCDDRFDPEPDLPDEQDSEILTPTLDANQVLVRELMQGEMFRKASSFHRKGINHMKRLLEAQDTPMSEETSYEQLANMEERLADILLQCSHDENKQEAMEVLQGLLSEEVKRADRLDDDRRARLYHKLGKLYYERGSIDQARKFVNRAFEGRRKMNPLPRELAGESAELLVKILQQGQVFDEANGLRTWIRQMLHQDTFSSSSSSHTMQDGVENTDPISAYQWCKEHGIDIDDDSFRFGDCDPISETTPMHRAIRAESIDVLRIMLSYEGDVERLDMSGSTLLHAAAATRNYNICELILEHAPKVVVFDRSGMTPLHRCQSGSGGVRVAKLLLETRSDLRDYADYFGKTALYMACEKGNTKMVEFLLKEAKADPNIRGPGQRTPLITTIDDVTPSSRKIDIVRLLIKHRADPWIKDGDGRTAFMAASNIGLAGSEIKRMLSEVPRRASSATVKATTSSSDDRSSNTI